MRLIAASKGPAFASSISAGQAWVDTLCNPAASTLASQAAVIGAAMSMAST